MANKNLFSSTIGKLLPKTNTVNEAGGVAYEFSPKHQLAQYAATGCLNGTYYASADMQLTTVLELCKEIDPQFIAKTAVYCRERGFMKDMPALLVAVLSVVGPEQMKAVFTRVVDNPKMLRNFVQIMRSGVVGRKSLGTAPKRLILEWLAARSDEQLFKGNIGQDPSLADIVKMVHPKPKGKARTALYGYLLGRKYDMAELPELVQHYEAYKLSKSGPVPKVPFQMLTSLDLGRDEWTDIARNAGWQMTRMNLNTFARHGVYDVEGMTDLIASRLSDEKAIQKARVFPYQLMMAFKAASGAPSKIQAALQDAMEIATHNVPEVPGKVYIFPDVSGSMWSPVTGYRKGSTTKVRCIDVAALVSATVLRRNPHATVIPFEQDVVPVTLNPRDSIMTNAEKLSSIGGGGTNMSASLAALNKQKAKGDLVVYVSDNESWIDTGTGWRASRSTETMRQWEIFKKKSPKAKMVCIDLQPYGNTQAPDRQDILNVGGFSDQVFQLLGAFATGDMSPGHWVDVIDAIEL